MSLLDFKRLHDRKKRKEALSTVVTALSPLEEVQQADDSPNAVVERLLKALSPATLSAYRRGLVAFAEFCGFQFTEKRPPNITRSLWNDQKRTGELHCIEKAAAAFLELSTNQADQLVEMWIRSMSEAGVAPKTQAVRVSAVKKLAELGRRPLTVKTPEAQTMKDTRGPSVDAVEKLLLACNDSPAGRRDRVIVWLLCLFGIRRAGVVKLKHRDYDREGKRLRVQLKGGKREQWFGLHQTPRCVEAIDRWLEVAGEGLNPNSALIHRINAPGKHLSLGGFNYIVRALGEKAGVKAWPHGLRHFAATTTAGKRGVRAVQKLLGHTNINTSMIYVDEHEDLAALAAGDIEEMLGARLKEEEE